jgi:hypothetical protein
LDQEAEMRAKSPVRFVHLPGVAVVIAAFLSAAASPAQEPPPQERSANLAGELAEMLAGTFQGSTPGNDLSLIVTSVMSPASPSQFDLPIRVSGKYGDSGARLQGVIHLENQGKGVLLQYTPHFDPVVGGFSAELQFTPQELAATCNFDVNVRGDGFFGQTIGSTTCVRAIRGAVGTWTFEVETGSIRIRNSGSGETLRFKRVSK